MNYLKIIFITTMVMVCSMTAFAGDESYTGEISIFAGKYAPKNHSFCDGRKLPISKYLDLYFLLGTTYGGDGRTTFALPNLKGAEKALNGPRYIIHLQGTSPPRP